MLENAGVLLGLALLIFLALRGVNVFIASLLSALVVAVTNGLNIPQALLEYYAFGKLGAFTFAGKFFLLFLAGAIFGRVMAETHAATSLALAMSKKLGADRTLVIGTIACALLTYGGVNVFIVIFTVYPLGLVLLREANMPKRLFVAACCLGAGTFTMTALPGSPSIHNVIAATALKTSLLASPWIGLISAAIMLVLGLLYLEWERKRAKARGDGFKAALTDVLPDEKLDTHNFPGPVMALVPLLAVLVIIIAPQMAGKFIAEPQGVIAFAISQPLLWPSLAMVIGALLAVVLLPKALQRPMKTLSRGAENAILPLMNTAAVIGFGGVVVQTAGFSKFAGLMIDADIDPLLSAFLSVNIVAGIVGSSSGGLQIFMESLAPHYIEAGVPPELLHRIATLGSGGLDSLPHCGAIITMFTVMGITHKEAYKDVAVITILIPLIATAAILAWLLIVGY